MRKLLLLAALLLPAEAFGTCYFTGGPLNLEIPRLGDSGAVWAGCLQRNFEKLDSTVPVAGVSGHAIEASSVPVIARSTINFVGDGVNVYDSAGKTFVDIPGAEGGHAVEGSSIPVVQRSTINFIGDGVSVYDSDGKTFVEIEGAAGGHAIEASSVPVVQRSTINFVGDGVSVYDSDGKTFVEIGVGVAGGDVIRTTHTLLPTQTTNSTAWTSVVGSTLTLVCDKSSPIRVKLNCNLDCVNNTSCPVAFSYLLDGDYFDGGTSATTTAIMAAVTDGMNIQSPEPLVIDHRSSTSVGIATHTLSLLWASTGGVDARIGKDMIGCSLTYEQEQDTLSTGSVAIVNGVIDFGAQSKISLRSLSCTSLPCVATGNSLPYGTWIATGTLAGQWMHERTGIGPYE